MDNYFQRAHFKATSILNWKLFLLRLSCWGTLPVMEHFLRLLWFPPFFCFTYRFAPTGLAVHLVEDRGEKCFALWVTWSWYNPAVRDISPYCLYSTTLCIALSLHWKWRETDNLYPYLLTEQFYQTTPNLSHVIQMLSAHVIKHVRFGSWKKKK